MVKIEEAWESKRILPGGTIGVFGSGQLGRMMALAARPLGYRVATFSQEADSPTGQVADHELIGHYDNEEAVAHFLTHVDVVTFEFENVGAHVAKLAQMQQIPVRPAGAVLYATQHRLREKQTLLDAGLPVARFAAVESLESLQVALTQIPRGPGVDRGAGRQGAVSD